MNTLSGAYSLEAMLGSLSLTAVIVGAGIVLTLLFFALIFAKRAPKLKTPIFTGIIVATVATSAIITACSAYLAQQSATGGAVSWQANFQIWACGNQLELRDPPGFYNNKIGTPALHEHNDNKIHLEGTPISLPYDFSLGKFLTVAGGKVTNNILDVPLNDLNYFAPGSAPMPELIEGFIRTEPSGKVAMFSSGGACGNDTAQVQAFVYRYNFSSAKYEQSKIADIARYEPTHIGEGGKSDCVILEFGPQKSKTSHICPGVTL